MTATAKKDPAKATETIVKLSNVRLSFPTLWVPKVVNGEGEPAYSATFIIGKEQTDVIKALEKAMLTAAKGKWADKAQAMVQKLRAADKTCLHDGDMKTEYDGFEGNFYLSCRSKIKPRVVNRQAELLTAEDGIPYAGCFVNGSVSIWAQNNNFGQRINATLRGVQFVKDGEAFGVGKPAGDDEFEEVAEGDADGEELA